MKISLSHIAIACPNIETVASKLKVLALKIAENAQRADGKGDGRDAPRRRVGAL